MANPRQPSLDKGLMSSQAGNLSGSNASSVGGHHPIQPRNQPHQTATQAQPNVAHLPLLRPHSRTTLQQRTEKIAIPRLHREPDLASTTGLSGLGDKHRVTHACGSCRHRKTKCSGDQPVCKHCADFNLTCVYEDGKRDRTRKRLETMTTKVECYEKLLQDLSQRVGATDQRLIVKALEQGTTPDDDEISATGGLRSGLATIYPGAVGDDNSSEADGETQVSARVGSTGSLDHVNEDFNQSVATRATGFIGKNSELTWMQRLNEECTPIGQTAVDGNPTSFDSDVRPESTPINNSTYHCDDESILRVGVNPNEMPPWPIADALFEMYLDIVHPSFPIIGKVNFVSQYHRFRADPNLDCGNTWKAILNLIFAIGAKHSHLVQASWRGHEEDHLVYFNRARILGFNTDAILGHSDLQRVQITGLMSFYLTAINQINRAWAMSGIAIRHACTLGLNLKNENKDLYESFKEIRYRVWWALCSNERSIAVMTGRPPSIMDADCSIPLPLPLDEEKFFSVKAPDSNRDTIRLFRRYSSEESQTSDNAVSTPSSAQSAPRTSSSEALSPESQPPNFHPTPFAPPSDALYFHHHAKLDVITGEVLSRIYRVDAAAKSWADVQSTIADLDLKLQKWLSTLPRMFDFTKRQRDQRFHRQRMSFGFFYYSTMIIISRPCLCRLTGKIPNQSHRSKDLNQSTAVKCVEAALGMLDLIPDQPNPVGLYEVAPWWSLVHHLVQAVTILMVELSFRSDHVPQKVDDILIAAKKAVGWLQSMSMKDKSAGRAWKLCQDLLRKVAPRVGRNIDELSSDLHMFSAFPVTTNPPDLETSTLYDPFIDMPLGRVEDMPFQPLIFTSYDEFESYPMLYPEGPL